jgi:hypothetical protein
VAPRRRARSVTAACRRGLAAAHWARARKCGGRVESSRARRKVAAGAARLGSSIARKEAYRTVPWREVRVRLPARRCWHVLVRPLPPVHPRAARARRGEAVGAGLLGVAGRREHRVAGRRGADERSDGAVVARDELRSRRASSGRARWRRVGRASCSRAALGTQLGWTRRTSSRCMALSCAFDHGTSSVAFAGSVGRVRGV